MTIPTTPEEQEARLIVIRRQLVDLQPVRQGLLIELRAVERQIEILCEEKQLIEKTQIKIKVCRVGTGISKVKPINTKQAIRNLDSAQTAELLAQLLRMQHEMEREELDEREAEIEEIDPEDDHPPMEPYCEEDEEYEDGYPLEGP